MKKNYTILSILILIITSTCLKAQNDSLLHQRRSQIEVGTLPGLIDVSSTGAAIYSIPLDLPPGRAGMTPQLALVYNSQGTNGLLGVGWSLGGLSSIIRTGTNLYFEDFIDGVDFDDNDKWMLDGSRLIPINVDDTIFRTEIETFSKIIAHDTVGNGPVWFEVFTKDGRIIEYGNTIDSRIEAQGKDDILFWRINRIEDRMGNYIDFIYTEYNGFGYIDEVKYTGNSDTKDNPTYTIKFNYLTSRPDVIRQWVSGSIIEYDELLNDIEIKFNSSGNTIKKYTLTYNQDFYSTLENLEMEDLDGNMLNPTLFGWGDPGNDFDKEYTGIPQNNDFEVDYTIGDFDGNGKTDIVCVYYNEVAGNKVYDHWVVYYSTGDGNEYALVIPEDSDLTETSFWYFIPGDFDGDGMDDLMMMQQTTPNKFYKSVGQQYPCFNYKCPLGNYYDPNREHYFINVDMNGNGKNELLLVRYNIPGENIFGTWIGAYEYNSDLNNFSCLFHDEVFQNDGYYFYHSETDLNPIVPGDFNGDGKTDILINTSAYYSHILELNEGDATLDLLFGSGYPTKLHQIIKTGDFNGDGITDLLSKAQSWELNYFNGKDGFVGGSQDCPIIEPIPPHYLTHYLEFKYLVGDYNGDGKSDILQSYQQWVEDPEGHGGEWDFKGTHWVVYYSNGIDWNVDSTYFTSTDPYLNELYRGTDFNGDGKNDCFRDGNNSIMFFLKNEQRYLVQNITNGLGVNTEIHYNPLTNNDIYIKGTGATYPMVDIQSPVMVTDIIKTDNGVGGYYEIAYKYEGAKTHSMGKGFLGFQKNTVTDYQAYTETIREYDIFSSENLYFHPYLKTVNQNSLSRDMRDPPQLLMTTNSFNIKSTVGDNDFIYLPVITESLQKFWDCNGAYIKTIKNKQDINDIDIYGNSKKQIILVDPGIPANDEEYDFKATIENSYSEYIDVENWLVGRPANTHIIKYYENDVTEDIVEINYDYFSSADDNWPLLMFRETIPNGSNEYITTEMYDYDDYGNLTQTTFEAPNADPAISDRITEYEYSPEYVARFLTKITQTNNNVEYSTHYEYYEETGNLKAEIFNKDNIPLRTGYEYDGFGKLTNTIHTDLIPAKTNYYWADGHPDAPPNASFYVVNRKETLEPVPTEFAKVMMFYDDHGRELRTVTWGLNDQKIYIEKEYNTKGFLDSSSEPYFATANPTLWTNYEYDDWGRFIQKTTPTNVIELSYNGREVTTTNLTTGVFSKKTVNAIGNPVLIEDPSGSINYEYFSSGNIKYIDALGSVTTMTYDLQGNQYTLDDPDAGMLIYKYNTFGELIRQEDDKGNIYNMTYDQLGRLISKELNNGSPTETTYYNYYEDPGLNGFGEISSVIGPNTITYTYNYDNIDRLVEEKEIIDGQEYETTYQYFEYNGNLKTYTYPSDFAIDYQYDDNGYLRTILHNQTQNVLWEALDANQRGQLTSYAFGNGLTTQKMFDDYGFPAAITTGQVQDLEYEFNPETGNLNFRKDNKFSLVENFGYDNILKERLELWGVNGLQVYEAAYDANGNILQKSDVTQRIPPGAYNYGHNAGPHAVTSVTNPTDAYMAKATPQIIGYTAFNKVANISQTIDLKDGASTFEMQFVYGPGNSRKRTKFFIDQTLYKTKYFIGGNYEIEKPQSGPDRILHYISGGDGIFAIFVQEGSKNTMYYIHKDYLGSYYCVTSDNGIVIELNNVEQIYSFDPWGQRRNHTDWSYEDIPISFLFDRGFTGHEHLDAFELINMNGRIYDPILGRMLSPDPFVQEPTYSQFFNRYSYCLNNPLKYTDPSGYTLIQTLVDRYAYDGGGFYYRGSYYSYNSETQLYTNSNGQVANSGGYHYDWNQGVYKNGYGQTVSWSEVKYGFIANFAQEGAIIYGGTDKNPYEVFRGFHFPDGSEWYTEDGIERLIEISGSSEGGSITQYLLCVLGVGNEIMFSKKFNTWMGKDGKIRSQNWGGNGPKGGKYKFAGKIGKVFKVGGWVLGAYGVYSTNMEWQSNQISTGEMITEQISNALGFIPMYGTAWSIGWYLGQNCGPSTWYGKNDYKWFE